MLWVDVEIKPSRVHGYGCFAKNDISKGTLIWSFSRIFDRYISEHVRKRATIQEQEKLFERGYVNRTYPDDIVMCGDEAQFLNFPVPPEEANIELGGVVDGQDVLIARREIKAGEELTVPPESDADYERKIAQRENK